ncbi:hypothetical protein K440DRAFT_368533 [Wilcoxina mikolae CBS 423.85]|nr:hypothetical protein K440DRAFT_368533 [Wilcoxina mikolae CBS 423.85]
MSCDDDDDDGNDSVQPLWQPSGQTDQTGESCNSKSCLLLWILSSSFLCAIATLEGTTLYWW